MVESPSKSNALVKISSIMTLGIGINCFTKKKSRSELPYGRALFSKSACQTTKKRAQISIICLISLKKEFNNDVNGILNTLFVFDEPPYQVVAPEGADNSEFIVWFLSSRKIRLYVRITNLHI